MRKVWNSFEEEIVRQLYHTATNEEIGNLVDATAIQVFRKASQMGLKKPREWYQTVGAKTIKTEASKATRFQKGMVPWNKGVKGSTGNHPNSVRTQFKKGAMSGAAQHNYRPIGSTRISKDGYLERKINDTHPVPARRWVGVHRLVWEAVHGPIPEGHIVVFKSGMKTIDPDLITIDRLELISKAENMRRNTLHRFPKELARAIQMRGALNRKINEAQRQRSESRDV